MSRQYYFYAAVRFNNPKRARLDGGDDSSSDSSSDSDKDNNGPSEDSSSSSESELSLSESEESSDDPDEDFNPFGNGSDSDDGKCPQMKITRHEITSHISSQKSYFFPFAPR